MKGPELRRAFIRDPVHWLAFGGGAGLMPVAPGTWGSLLGLLLFLLLPAMPPAGLWGLVGAISITGVWICGQSARRLGVHDHPAIVWDEIAGMFIVAACQPRSPVWMAAAFGAFRLFDIFKPWPIRDLDHSLRGGLGIMLDDVVAAVYAVLLLLLAQRLVAAF